MHQERSRLIFDVTAILPARVAGAGRGSKSWIGALEITEMERLERDVGGLCLGDLIAIDGIDAGKNRFFSPDCVTIGVVVCGPSPAQGRGIGATVLFSGSRHRLDLGSNPMVNTAKPCGSWTSTPDARFTQAGASVNVEARRFEPLCLSFSRAQRRLIEPDKDQICPNHLIAVGTKASDNRSC